jgi:hypothetical protein
MNSNVIHKVFNSILQLPAQVAHLFTKSYDRLTQIFFKKINTPFSEIDDFFNKTETRSLGITINNPKVKNIPSNIFNPNIKSERAFNSKQNEQFVRDEMITLRDNRKRLILHLLPSLIAAGASTNCFTSGEDSSRLAKEIFAKCSEVVRKQGISPNDQIAVATALVWLSAAHYNDACLLTEVVRKYPAASKYSQEARQVINELSKALFKRRTPDQIVNVNNFDEKLQIPLIIFLYRLNPDRDMKEFG